MEINSVTIYEVNGGVAVINTDAPPVNALSHRVRTGIVSGMERAIDDPSVRAIVIRCSGRTFYAGADITEFAGGIQEPILTQVQDVIEGSPKPVVAAIHGTALGGGLELALVAHFRIAVRSARLGLPEVKLGLIPGAGGTQRLPRIVGVTRALDLLTSGAQISAEAAFDMGLLDALCDADALEEEAIRLALAVADRDLADRRIGDRSEGLREAAADPSVFTEFRAANADRFRGFQAPEYAVRAVEAAVALPFDEGMAEEQRLIHELFAGSQSAAQQYIFFAQRLAAKPVGLAAGVKPRAVGAATAIGGGASVREWGDRLRRADVAVVIAEDDAPPGADLVLIDGSAEPGLPPSSVVALCGAVSDPRAALSRWPGERTFALYALRSAEETDLIEVVHDASVAPDVLSGAMALGKRLGAVAVATRAAAQPLYERLRAAFLGEVDALVAQGVSADAIARGLDDFGFAADLTRQVRSRPIGTVAECGVDSGTAVERLLDMAANEGARALESGQAGRASDIDLLWVFGLGWPKFDGGPMHRADRIGLATVAERLREPATLLRERALADQKLTEA